MVSFKAWRFQGVFWWGKWRWGRREGQRDRRKNDGYVIFPDRFINSVLASVSGCGLFRHCPSLSRSVSTRRPAHPASSRLCLWSLVHISPPPSSTHVCLGFRVSRCGCQQLCVTCPYHFISLEKYYFNNILHPGLELRNTDGFGPWWKHWMTIEVHLWRI